MRHLPPDLIPYKRTPTFDEGTVPKGLLAEHSLKAGTWGLIVVLEGELDYVIEAPDALAIRLSAERRGTVEPEVPHHVEVVGPVHFYVEFYRPPAPNAAL